MFDIINLKEEDGVKLFFEEEEKLIKFINIIIDENTKSKKKIAFYRLSGLIFQNYIWPSINFNLKSFIKSTLNSIDQEDNKLAYFSLLSLNCLYKRIKKISSTKEFNSIFIESDGKDIIKRSFSKDCTELHDQAASFMENVDGFDV